MVEFEPNVLAPKRYTVHVHVYHGVVYTESFLVYS